MVKGHFELWNHILVCHYFVDPYCTSSLAMNDLGLFVWTPNYWGEGDGGIGESCPPPQEKKNKEKHREVVEITIFFRSKLYSFVLERKRKEYP